MGNKRLGSGESIIETIRRQEREIASLQDEVRRTREWSRKQVDISRLEAEQAVDELSRAQRMIGRYLEVLEELRTFAGYGD